MRTLLAEREMVKFWLGEGINVLIMAVFYVDKVLQLPHFPGW